MNYIEYIQGHQPKVQVQPGNIALKKTNTYGSDFTQEQYPENYGVNSLGIEQLYDDRGPIEIETTEVSLNPQGSKKAVYKHHRRPDNPSENRTYQYSDSYWLPEITVTAPRSPK